MSGGAWGYRSTELRELAGGRLPQILEAVAETEHICDWAVSGDTSREEAAKELFDLWVKTFDAIYG